MLSLYLSLVIKIQKSISYYSSQINVYIRIKFSLVSKILNTQNQSWNFTNGHNFLHPIIFYVFFFYYFSNAKKKNSQTKEKFIFFLFYCENENFYFWKNQIENPFVFLSIFLLFSMKVKMKNSFLLFSLLLSLYSFFVILKLFFYVTLVYFGVSWKWNRKFQ